MNIGKELVFPGRKLKIYGITNKGKCLATKFIDECSQRDRDKLLALIKRLAHEGQIYNLEQFRHEGNKIFAFKSRKARIFCFFDTGGTLFLTHGWTKEKDRPRTFATQKKRAKDLRDEYLKAKGTKR